MKYIAASILFAVLAIPDQVFSFDSNAFPKSIGSDPVLTRTEEIKKWDPENMFEQVNGEAELLKRYGVVSLTVVSYAHDSGDYVSVDFLDMGAPINAYGLYRLYAGCDGKELSIHNATVLQDEFTPYAFHGQYFLRINLDTGDSADNDIALVTDFLKYLTKHVPEQLPLPSVLEYLKQNARTPCEVNYQPDHVDYDLETGPGYSWVGQDDRSYFVVMLDSQEDAEAYVKNLKEKGISSALSRENAVIWENGDDREHIDYMNKVLTNIVEK